ncbi:MAG: polyphenol oxidase family protein [Actinomycetota bacterium]|nr:polyphenol oxidase family protein [Actinomycetota bacterium]
MFPLAVGRSEPSAPGGRPARWAATGRSGGVSPAPYDTLNLAGYVGDLPGAVTENRDRVARAMGSSDLATMRCVHGAAVARVHGPSETEAVDGLVTTNAGLVLLALGADCVPLAIIGSNGMAIGVAHCGWRGLVGDVIGEAVNAVAALAGSVQEVVLGPAVCGACYPVPPERVDMLRDAVSRGVCTAAIATRHDGQPGIDVRAGARARFVELGVPARIIRFVGGCTVEDQGLFSYRRDGVTGRQGMAACIVEGT